ncbi:MAG: hypothetical protein CM15mV5_1320 [uncultured marine virus]|nr:MAG: hypothetical protein CM15mV5_1320 [uncultured marine virus]
MTPEAERFNGWANAWFRCSSWSICNNRSNHTRYILMTPNKNKTIEQEKLFAEKFNGRLAMLGIIAGIGAYLTTGQLIPGYV